MKSDLDALMKERNLDAIMILGDAEHNPPMYYFVGGGHVSGGLLLKKQGEEPVLFHNDMERDEAAKSGMKTRSYNDYPWQDFMEKASGDMQRVKALRLEKILTDYRLEKARIALFGKLELSDIFGVIATVSEYLPDVDFIGESVTNSVILQAMETKEDVEVARIRRMGAVTTEVVGMVRDLLISSDVRDDEVLLKEDGTPLTIGDVKSNISLWLAERGASDAEGVIFAQGRDAGVPHSLGTPDEPVRLGKTIVFDIFPNEKGGGFFHDFTRTWSLGYADPEAQAMYDQVHEIYDKLIDNLDLNADFRDYERMTCEYFESKGHKSPLNTKNPLDGYVHSLGHGVGINIHERPNSSLVAGDNNILKPGVVITIEPGLYYPEKGMGFRIEDTYWVNPDGQFERLADFPYDFVLPMKKWKK